MAEVLLPPRTRVASSSMKYLDSTGSARAIYTGALETTAFGGDRLGATLTLTPVGGLQAADRAKRGRLLGAIVGLGGKQNRIWMPDHSYTRRGSFPAAELHPDGSLRDVNKWGPANGALLTVTDGALRVTLAGAAAQPGADSTVVVPALNVPYCVRAFLRSGRGMTTPSLFVTDGVVSSGASLGADGLVTLAYVPTATGITMRVYGAASNGMLAGDFLECSYASFARCALVDGGPNLLLHSDAPGGTSWTLAALTAVANISVGPDGFTDASNLTETTANSGHYTYQAVSVTSAVQDFTLSVYVKANGRTWCWLQLIENTGSTAATCFFNLSTGAAGASPTVGTNWANLRTSSEDCGSGWRRLSITAHKTNTATSITGLVGAASADNTNSYVGSTGSVAIIAWRASLSSSSFPTRGTQTVASAAGAANDAARYIYLKGLPPSTQGLLLAGDQVQIGKQLTVATSSLDSNEAGLGYLQISPPLRYAPADNDPVIIVEPMGRFVFTGDYPTWENQPGVSTTSDLDFEEDCRVS